MLARIHNSGATRLLALLLLASGVLALTSCATKQEPTIVSDGQPGRESALPWNKQEKWEGAGQFGAMADAMNSRR